MSDYIGMEKLKDEEMEKWSTNLMNLTAEYQLIPPPR